jgi:uncharacterized protein YutE (UPF0331/DUF86 family)
MKDEILAKLEMLKGYVEILRGYRGHTLEEVKTNPTLRGAIERYLQVALECTFDVGEMIISLGGFRKPGTYKEVIEVLGEKGVLSEEFVKRFAPAAGFRNILVHMYAEVNVEKVHKFLQENLEDFNDFVKQIAKYLMERGPA